jgi:hypothetical protein
MAFEAIYQELTPSGSIVGGNDVQHCMQPDLAQLDMFHHKQARVLFISYYSGEVMSYMYNFMYGSYNYDPPGSYDWKPYFEGPAQAGAVPLNSGLGLGLVGQVPLNKSLTVEVLGTYAW